MDASATFSVEFSQPSSESYAPPCSLLNLSLVLEADGEVEEEAVVPVLAQQLGGGRVVVQTPRRPEGGFHSLILLLILSGQSVSWD